VTVTIGGISWSSGGPADADTLLTAADLALYAGKSDGRNRSVIRVLPAELPSEPGDVAHAAS
jgi:PleD family two-component response regulator